jgi:hypothetical protein
MLLASARISARRVRRWWPARRARAGGGKFWYAPCAAESGTRGAGPRGGTVVCGRWLRGEYVL